MQKGQPCEDKGRVGMMQQRLGEAERDQEWNLL